MNRKKRKHFFIAGIISLLLMAGACSSFGAPFAYIPFLEGNSVIVIDLATNKLLPSIPVGTGPRGVAVNAAGTRVYVTNYSSDTVSVIDGTTQTVIGSPIPVGDGPDGIALSPSGSIVYIANQESETISVINAVTNTVIDTITGIPCTSLAMDPSGSRLYVASDWDQDLRVINTATRTVMGASLHFSGRILNMTINPTGTHLYLSVQDQGVAVVRTSDGAVTQIPTANSPEVVAVHPSGAFAYAAAWWNAYVIDAGMTTVINPIEHPGARCSSVFFNREGTKAYFQCIPDDVLKVVDTETHTVIDTIEIEPSSSSSLTYGSFVAPHRHVWSGDTSFTVKLTGLGDTGKYVKENETITGKVIETRTLGTKYSLLFLSDDLRSSIYLPDVTFLMTEVDGSKSEKAMLGGTGKYYFHDGSTMISGIAHFNGTATLKKDGPGGNFISATLTGTIAGGKLQEQYFTGKVRAKLLAVQ